MPDRDVDRAGTNEDEGGSAVYLFRVRFRVEPRSANVHLEPATFETTLRRDADQPGETGWLFFRDNLWRGAINDDAHFRDLVEEALGVTVMSVSFRELRTDAAYLDALRTEVGQNLDLFRADDTVDALHKYLGSSIHVRDD